MERITVGWPCWGKEEKESAISAIQNVRLSQGKFVKEFERLWAEKIGVKYAVACNSGTSGNYIAYQALIDNYSWDNKSEIIAPANAFPSAISPFNKDWREKVETVSIVEKSSFYNEKHLKTVFWG